MKLKEFILEVVEYWDTSVVFKRNTILFALALFYVISFFHQIRYGAFSPILYMWLLLMLLIYLILFSKPLNKSSKKDKNEI